MENNKIICTIGPTSFNEDIMNKLEKRSVFLVRINLSHVLIEELKNYIIFLKKFEIPIAIDTEGAQVRTGILGDSPLVFQADQYVYIHRNKIDCDFENIYFTPSGVIDLLMPGDLISLDFNSVLLRVDDNLDLKDKNYIKTRVLIEGLVGNNKGVHCDHFVKKLPPFTDKDLKAIELAKKHNIKYFTLSFINDSSEVKKFKKLYPDSIVYAKIETIKGIQNIKEILKDSEGILIDRGDLSREIPIQKIPLVQKILVNEANLCRKDVFIASNLLETMADELKPSRAEANDIVNSIIDGVTGFVLTKETAVGKYPIETVNMLETLMNQGLIALHNSERKNNSFSPSINLSGLKEADYINATDSDGFLIQPHGGKLINRVLDATKSVEMDFHNLMKLEVDENVLMDLEQIGIGGYSPLKGFLCKKDYKSVLDNMKLSDGTLWPIPITLTITKEEKDKIKLGDNIAIISAIDKSIYGFMNIEDIFAYSKIEYAKKIFGTTNSEHPGIKKLNEYGDYMLGGEILLKKRIKSDFSHYNLTPKQTRAIFESLGWAKVIGFHTRNAIHRSHEFIQINSLNNSGCDGLFVHPVIGTKKKGDFKSKIIIKSYELMIEKHYPKNKVIFGVFSTFSRYAGPREAVFTALCRKNYGCSHFIIGRDHTGVGNYYVSKASQKIFEKLPDIGMELVFVGEIGYSEKTKEYINVNQESDNTIVKISGSEARKMFADKINPPEWYIRKSISKMIIEKISKGEDVFIK
jgi:pyruvate kinase